MEKRQQVLEIINRNSDDMNAIVDGIITDRLLSHYVIEIGILHIKAQARSRARREFRRELQPEYKDTNRGKMFTSETKKRLLNLTKRLFGPEGWQIGELNIGDITREGLFAEAERERKLSNGHTKAAEIYEAMATPMLPGQLVKEYWTVPQLEKMRSSMLQKEGRLP